jgi:two-component system OmpR family response regulator/two-component system response regulator QseB
MRVLLAEDDPLLGASVRRGLEQEGFAVDWVTDGAMGADDYLVKPFDLLELCARLRAVGRRARRECDETLECGDVQLSCDTRTVTRAREPVELSRREFRVLEALLRNRNRVLTRDQLERSLYSWGEEVESNAVDVHVHHLRRKLGRHLIETVRGVGYRIRARARSEA